MEADDPGKGGAKGKGQSIACIAAQMNNGQGKGKESQPGSRETLSNYDDYRLLGEYDSSGGVVQETVWLGSLPVDTVQSGRVYFVHADHLGTPRVITDGDNTAVWTWESDPFGVAAANEDPDDDSVKLTYNLRFPGQYYDSETGKHYNYFRDYNSRIGRYDESDPIGLDAGLNAYTYVLAAPVNHYDPHGLTGLEATMGAGAFAEGGVSFAGAGTAAAWVAGPVAAGAAGYYGTSY